MQRALVLAGTFLLSTVMIGCGGDTRNDLIAATVQMMTSSASQMKLISGNINDAVKKAEKDNTTLDFTDALKSTDKLKKIGEEAQRIKGQLAAVGTISEDEKQTNAEQHKDAIKKGFTQLVTEREELRKSLDKAEAMSKAGSVNATKTRDLRDKLRDALSPFETMARQSL